MTVILRKEVDCEGIFVNTEEFIVPSIRKYLPNYKEILEFFGGMPPILKKEINLTEKEIIEIMELPIEKYYVKKFMLSKKIRKVFVNYYYEYEKRKALEFIHEYLDKKGV